MMKNFIYKVFMYGMLCLFTLNTISFIGNYFLRKSSFYKPSFLINQFDKKNTLDYIILGSSRGLTTLDSKKINKQLNIKGINLSMDDTDLKSHILMLKHFINNGFTAKYCILTLDKEHFNKTYTKLGNNDYKFISFAHQNHIKKHYKQYETQVLKPLYNADWLPILSFGYFNLELLVPSVIGIIKPEYKNRYDYLGNYNYPELKKFYGSNTFKPIDSYIDNPLVKKIQDIAFKNNIQLIIYIAPYRTKKIILKNNKSSIVNHSSKLVNASLFYDNIHVNKTGRAIATNNFITDFKSFLKK